MPGTLMCYSFHQRCLITAFQLGFIIFHKSGFKMLENVLCAVMHDTFIYDALNSQLTMKELHSPTICKSRFPLHIQF